MPDLSVELIWLRKESLNLKIDQKKLPNCQTRRTKKVRK